MTARCPAWRVDWKHARIVRCSHPATHAIGGKWHWAGNSTHMVWHITDRDRRRAGGTPE